VFAAENWQRLGKRRQPDITFRAFAETYLKDHAALHKKDKGARDREILKTLNRAFGSLILHEITTHRIEQFKRDRLAGTWRAHSQKSNPKPLKPGTVNRERDTLKSILSKAVEWGKLVTSSARGIERLKVDNRRTRILTPDEQRRLLEAAPRKMRAFMMLALITSARAGELLGLRWQDITADALTFLETKNGKPRRLPLSPAARAVLANSGRFPADPTSSPIRGQATATRSMARGTSSTGQFAGPPSLAPTSLCTRSGTRRSAGWWRRDSTITR
jgi:integrase